MKFKFTYFSYSSIILLVLTLMISLSTFLAPIFDLRLLITSIMYVLLSAVVLYSISYLLNRDNFSESKNKILFITLTFIYSMGFLWANISFIATQQILRSQSFFFLMNIFPKTMIVLSLIILLFLIFGIIFILNRKVHVYKIDKKQMGFWRYLILVCIFFLFAFIYIIPSTFGIFDPLVEKHVQGQPTFIVPEKIVSERIVDYETSLERPNILFFMLESVSAERLGVYGYERNVTPNIDDLANKGFLFKNAYTTATHTDYAQPALVSSRYMLNNYERNVFDNNPSRTMLWDFFKEMGYDTAYILAMDDRWAGVNKYFNYSNVDFYSTAITDGSIDFGSGYASTDFDHNTTKDALNWLESRDSDEPFFLYVNYEATHLPLVYPDEFRRYVPDSVLSAGFITFNNINNTNNRFDNSISYVDYQVGKIISYLEETNQLNNTIVVITPDHGHDFLRRHDIEGHGNSIYDEELKVPLIMYFPDLENEVIEDEVSHIDVFPTLLNILGIENHKNYLGSHFKKDNRFFFYAQNHKHFIGMLKDDLKVIVDLNKKTSEVYNVTSDPNELRDLTKESFYDQEILELLQWHTCQLEYFSKDMKDNFYSRYCDNFLDDEVLNRIK